MVQHGPLRVVREKTKIPENQKDVARELIRLCFFWQPYIDTLIFVHGLWLTLFSWDKYGSHIILTINHFFMVDLFLFWGHAANSIHLFRSTGPDL